MILAGDIGGTNSRLALYTPDGRRSLRAESFQSRDYPSLEKIIRKFLGIHPPPISVACIGIAGPIVRQRCKATNLPWTIDAHILAHKLNIKRVVLINDLVALAFGALSISRNHIKLLQGEGFPKKKGANLIMVAAGTGLGEALLIWDGLRFIPCATEGGHVDFAPRNALEWRLYNYLQSLYGHVSYERILSGPGLTKLYDFFKNGEGIAETPSILKLLQNTPAQQHPAMITQLASDKRSPPAISAVKLFLSIYGAEAGNMALKTLSLGGVFIAGNIASQIFKTWDPAPFLSSFVDKGRFRKFLQQIPVAVVQNTDIGLAGSAYYATHP
ncbi:glucokinase [Pajaroellobacter abortibovis]|uniref:Glucokinase n=1 Tax=Pajaroellobacter abortibovis TaxID=1882918 RepID=A0A1L6MXB8_9BACT|nr:glucokinase [Pajaroellobacter abortibovis]APS00075.1 glucokinase [Pajaroellobacter abortibovis]